jgi:hypothetical protein
MTTLWLSRKPTNTLRADATEVRIERSKPKVNQRPDEQRRLRRLRLKACLANAVLAPLCLFAMLAFKDMFFHPQVQTSHWFSYFYVFGHEWTHIFATRLCGGIVYDHYVGRDGGWVDTNKSNTFISLSPYLIPFYTFFVVLGFAAAGLFVHLDRVLLPQGQSLLAGLTLTKALYFSVGLTWCFHLSYTLRTLRHQQTDLLRNGLRFSRLLIFIVNLALVAVFLIIASPTITLGSAQASLGQTTAWVVDKYWGSIVSTSRSLAQEARRMRSDLETWRNSSQAQPLSK